ncbi:MAG: helix-turn-helix transcriptional regulator, partial [Anaerolineales bacterium]
MSSVRRRPGKVSLKNSHHSRLKWKRRHTLEPFPVWLKHQRRALDLSRKALAQRAHCSASAIWRLETGDLRPSVSVAASLAAVLAVLAEAREAFVRFARGEPGGERFTAVSPNPVGGLPPQALSPTHLPAPLTSFVGRTKEIGAVGELLRQADVRL